MVCLIETLATALRGDDQAGLFEHAKMTRGCRPRMTKAGGNLARRHFAPAKMDGHQNLTPGRVSQSREDCIELGQALLCFT